MNSAIALYNIYAKGYAFPSWVLDPKAWSTFKFHETIVYYHREDSIEDVKLLMKIREPCNIGMKRRYDKEQMKTIFGWSTGAYGRSTAEHLMPNIAVYCHATVLLNKTKYINVHVINLIGYAFDSHLQPDAKYLHLKDLVAKYQHMWRFALAAAKHLRGQIHTIKIYNVGGGAFAGPYYSTFITDIFEPSFLPLVPEFKKIGIKIDGYDFQTKEFNGGFIPDVLITDDYTKILYVNAWDPWSIIGNGNFNDNSLDGYWGRYSNMSVLGWSVTNPYCLERLVAI